MLRGCCIAGHQRRESAQAGRCCSGRRSEAGTALRVRRRARRSSASSVLDFVQPGAARLLLLIMEFASLIRDSHSRSTSPPTDSLIVDWHNTLALRSFAPSSVPSFCFFCMIASHLSFRTRAPPPLRPPITVTVFPGPCFPPAAALPTPLLALLTHRCTCSNWAPSSSSSRALPLHLHSSSCYRCAAAFRPSWPFTPSTAPPPTVPLVLFL